MISRAELQRLANRENVALGILEKDYVLTEVLKALSQVPELRDVLVFKGGTALRKVYFPGWRYSEDMDFSARHDIMRQKLGQALEAWYRRVEQDSGVRLTTRMLHKLDGYARVRIQFLGPLAYPGMVYMDLTFDEPLCLEPEYRRVLTAPFAGEERDILVYPLEELFAEKLRSLLERGKSRDYYDVWRFFKEHPAQADLELLGAVLGKKLAHKGIRLHDTGGFLPADPGELKSYWEQDLGQQVSPLPPLDEVLEELRGMLDELLSPHFPP